jgi:hypothetical protein
VRTFSRHDDTCPEHPGSGFYHPGPEVGANGVPLDDLHRSIEINLSFIVGALADPQITHAVAAPSEAGRRRAHHGASLPEVLRCLRIGCGCSGTRWSPTPVTAAGRPNTRDAIVDAASLL